MDLAQCLESGLLGCVLIVTAALCVFAISSLAANYIIDIYSIIYIELRTD